MRDSAVFTECNPLISVKRLACWAKISRWHFEKAFIFFPENIFLHFGDNMHETSNLILLGKNIASVSSAELAERAVYKFRGTDQKLRWGLSGHPRIQGFYRWTATTLVRLCRYRLIYVFVRCTYPKIQASTRWSKRALIGLFRCPTDQGISAVGSASDSLPGQIQCNKTDQ